MLLLFSAGIKEYAKRYDLDCANKTICEFNFTVVELMNAPVFVYYQLDDFY
jgi:hypothetical protein